MSEMSAGYLASDEFWADEGVYVAGEFEGELPDLGGVRRPVLFKTSGSTGRAKWIVLEKGALQASAVAVNEWLGVTKESKWGLSLPLNHVGGFGVVARTRQAGCGMASYEGKWDAVRFSEWIGREGVTHVSLVPTQVYDLLKAGLRGAASLRAVVVGGGWLPEEMGQAARDAGWPVLASYGMTEACSQIATQEMGLVGGRFAESPLRVFPIWSVETSEGGLLRLKGEALFSGVVEEEGGDWVFRERQGEWFETRDRVSLEGGVLVPGGRADLQVKVMGELVDMEKVERLFLEKCGGKVSATGFAVAAVSDERKEHSLIAVCEVGSGFSEEAFQNYNNSAPGVERLDRWIEIESLPKTDLGKLRRAKLKEICEKMIAEVGK